LRAATRAGQKAIATQMMKKRIDPNHHILTSGSLCVVSRCNDNGLDAPGFPHTDGMNLQLGTRPAA
jgi:hypothetical protein